MKQQKIEKSKEYDKPLFKESIKEMITLYCNWPDNIKIVTAVYSYCI